MANSLTGSDFPEGVESPLIRNTPPSIQRNTLLNTLIDMSMATMNARINSLRQDVRAGAGAATSPAPQLQGAPSAPDKPLIGNCQGPLRSVVFVKGKFILGSTGLTDTVTVE